MILESASVKFQLIHNMLESEDCSMSITEICSFAGVSRGGYYYWLNQEEARIQREAANLEDFSLVLEAYKFRGYAKVPEVYIWAAAFNSAGSYEYKEDTPAYG